MVKSLYVDNFRMLSNFRVDFSQINILMGKNGTGKSTIFYVLKQLCDFILGKDSVNKLFPEKNLTRWTSANVQTFELKLEQDNSLYDYKLEVEHNRDNHEVRVKSESLSKDETVLFKARLGNAILFNDIGKQGPEILVNWSLSGISLVNERSDNKNLFKFKKLIEKIIVCSPEVCLMNSVTKKECMFPDYNLSNIVDVFRAALMEHPDVNNKLTSLLKEINPAYSIAVLKGNEEEKKLTLLYNSKEYGEMKFAFDELSDGEKMIFSLYFLAVLSQKLHYCLFVDEPDKCVEIKELKPYISFIEDIVAETEDFQFVVISHNPEIINTMAYSYSVWLERLSYGISRISEAPAVTEGLTYSELIAREM